MNDQTVPDLVGVRCPFDHRPLGVGLCLAPSELGGDRSALQQDSAGSSQGVDVDIDFDVERAAAFED